MGTVNKQNSIRPPKTLGSFGGTSKIRSAWNSQSLGEKVFWVILALVVLALATMNW
ncbi:hypothetical protein D3C87_1056470 [compost metagenome]